MKFDLLFSSIFIFLLIILFMIVHVYIQYNINNDKFRKNNSKKSKIPKIIWTYWDTIDKPVFIQNCIKTWKYYNPDYTINILDKNNYRDFISIPLDYKAFDPVTRFTDYLRFQLLFEHGGIWMDASIICNESLNWIFEKENVEFVGFDTPLFMTNDKYPIIENWFLACVPGSRLMEYWNKEVQNIRSFSKVDDYIQSLYDQTVDLQKIPFPEYLMCHAALMKVFHDYGNNFDTHLINSIGDNGPFRYLYVHDWKSKEALKSLCIDIINHTSLIKIRGDERKEMEKTPFLEDSLDCFFYD